VLQLLSAVDPFSWIFWDGPDRRLDAWYINLQEPFRRVDGGIDTQDLELDFVVKPDGSWHRKDDDLLDAWVQKGRWTTEQVRRFDRSERGSSATNVRGGARGMKPGPDGSRRRAGMNPRRPGHRHPVGLRGGRLRHEPTAVGLVVARSAQNGELPCLRVKGLRDPFGQAGHHDARSEGRLGTRVTSCRRPHSKRRRTCSLGRRR
jgi:Protein of unknown function (DUF402)